MSYKADVSSVSPSSEQKYICVCLFENSKYKEMYVSIPSYVYVQAQMNANLTELFLEPKMANLSDLEKFMGGEQGWKLIIDRSSAKSIFTQDYNRPASKSYTR